MTLNGSSARSMVVSDGDVYATGNLYLCPPEGGRIASEAVMWKYGAICWRSGIKEEALGNSIFVSGNDIYIAGHGPVFSASPRAILWKNGKAQYLSAGSSCYANSVFVSGKDVYVAGRFRPTSKNKDPRTGAVLWKNGAAQYLSDTSAPTSEAEANSVYVSGNDVYVAGEVSGRAALGKNGTIQMLPSDGGSRSSANSVLVSADGDVYVTGSEYDPEGCSAAIMWINGAKLRLGDGNTYGSALSASVSDGDVYVAGQGGIFQNYQGSNYTLLWKNGARLDIPNVSETDFGHAVLVCGGDVYLAGSSFLKAAVWKNGEMMPLQEK
jgi:hypothetical protein